MKKENVINIINILKDTYPDAKCSLDFNSPFELLVAVMLSAQCTDERVNKTVPFLFEKYSTADAMANIDILELESIIKPCGFYKNKAKNIKAMSKIIVEKYNGIVPDSIEELVTLPGVGRKSANVMLLEAFNHPQGIAVDTHAKRLSNRIGFSKESDPLKIENDLIRQIPKEYFRDVNHIFMWHGRNICTARNPKCDTCPISSYCYAYVHKKITK